MRWKISNTLWVTALFLFIVGILFNWGQAKQSVESHLEKARKVKAEKQKEKKAEKSKRATNEEDLDNTKSPTNGVLKKAGDVKLEEIEIIKK
jgi:hypothetical protein